MRSLKIMATACRDLEAISEYFLKQQKLKMFPTNAKSCVHEIRSFSQVIEITNKLKGIVCDPNDDMVIECAVLGKVSHIVTGDNHLLSLSRYQDIAIVRAADFLALMAE